MGRDDTAAGAAKRAAEQGHTVFAWATTEKVGGKSKELVSLGMHIGSIEAAGWKLEQFVPRWTALNGDHKTTLLFRRA
ncbi:MAG: hypothetical protein ABI635_09295 [Actinomycetota bacterium]